MTLSELLLGLGEMPSYKDELWWCNSHNRKATYVDEIGQHRCDPKLGGRMIPCMVVNLTGIADIVDDGK